SDVWWLGVVEELTTAIGVRWRNLRSLVIARYDLTNTDRSHAAILAADEIWAELERQESAMDEDVRGTELARWRLPVDADSILSSVQNLWYSMWGATAEEQEVKLENRLCQVLLPRLVLDDPILAAHVRRLIDAIEDLTDARDMVHLYNKPFPSTPTGDEGDE